MLPYAIYGFVVTFNLFYLSFFMSGGGPFGRTELFVTEAYKLVNDFQLYGVAAAFSVLMFFLLLFDHARHQPAWRRRRPAMPTEPMSTTPDARGRGLTRIRSRDRQRAGRGESARDKERSGSSRCGQQIGLQLLCLFITLHRPLPGPVDLPARARPSEPVATGQPSSRPAHRSTPSRRVIAQPTSDPISFFELARNSFVLASSMALFSVLHRRARGVRVLAAAVPAAASSS